MKEWYKSKMDESMSAYDAACDIEDTDLQSIYMSDFMRYEEMYVRFN